MYYAFCQARRAYEIGEVPVGAVLIDVKKKKLVSEAFNTIKRDGNPLAHAELIAINDAISKKGGGYLEDYCLYTTLEPCQMCAGAIALARVGKLYIGCEDKRFGAVINGARVFSSGLVNHIPEIYHGIMEKECSALLTDFFMDLREENGK